MPFGLLCQIANLEVDFLQLFERPQLVVSRHVPSFSRPRRRRSGPPFCDGSDPLSTARNEGRGLGPAGFEPACDRL